VQSGAFGACLMRRPALVGECVAAMKRAVSIPVTVKCRIGVDEQDPEVALDELAEAVWAAGADALWVHARKAWLEGLSPKENRDIPPLDYDRVYRLKAKHLDRFVGINGGIQSLDEAARHLEHVDGAMLGRAAYHTPGLLAEADAVIYGDPPREADWAGLIETMADYAARHIAAGGRLAHITRHMVGLFHGLPGARRWRQILSTDATRPGAGPDVLSAAFAAVDLSAGSREAA
jgi:tRNA-dihydrouridine synthase A